MTNKEEAGALKQRIEACENAYVEIFDQKEALEQRVELIERAEAQMIGEDAQPHTEWLWYFDALASQEEA